MRILVFFALAACVFAAEPAATAVRCGHMLDVASGRLTGAAVILIKGDRIGAAGESTQIPAGARVVDWSAYTCLPGLVDAHDHLTSDPTDNGYEALGISIPRQTVKGVRNARLTLHAGFTTVRNVAADGYSDVALRDGINAGDIPGPRLLVSGPALGITGGHCDNNLLAPEFHYTYPAVADGPWAARAKVREVVKYGADLIKICASGGVLSKGDQPGTPQYSVEEIRAITTEAHKLGRKVAAHAEGTQSIKDAIEGGVDSVEHATLIDDEGVRMAKERGTYLVMDIYNHEFIVNEGLKVGMLRESIAKEEKLGGPLYENFRRAYKGGAKIVFGTDGGVYPHGDNAKQFATMVREGMPAIDALRSATVTAAALLGMENDIGTLEPGKFADVIAVSGNPLEHIETLQKVQGVMKGGVVQ